MGRQVHIRVGESDFYMDLLFYHARLHCYVVVELKTEKFKPEFAGKLNFYVTAVNKQIKTLQDNPTIGILICKDKDDVVAEYALDDISQPIGIAEYELTKVLREEFKSSLPTVEEIENGTVKFTKQKEEDATFVKLIQKEDALLNFHEKASTLVNKVRAYVESPVAYFFVGGERIKVYKAKVSALNEKAEIGEIITTKKEFFVKAKDVFFEILSCQAQGGKVLNVRDFLNGYHFKAKKVDV